MAWRPKQNLVQGELDNTVPGLVTGWLEFRGMSDIVRLNLAGNFHEDIRGKKIRLRNREPQTDHPTNMDRFVAQQTGVVGDITAGLPPYPYSRYPYVEIYSRENGRVVMEFDADEVEVVDQ
ncbi:MAG: hypothetical protein NT049_06680 [Planctomycetota bacterium]|nr:hypothetical protein [Planctomycetota bacterium]